MTPHEFIQKWQAAQLSERSACQQHFLDLCDLLGQPKPAAADPEGTWYTFERGVRKNADDPNATGYGWADVWLRGHFGWEYKGKHKDLAAAYKQLLQYREDLENPPLLIVCDLDRFEIHTNFTGTVKQVHKFSLAELAEPANLDLLRRVFTDPESLRPGQTTEAVTAQAAELIGQIADGMRQRGIPAHDAAHFLMKLMFSMFAEDIGLLNNKVFTQVMQAAAKPGAVNACKKLTQLLKQLFDAMAHGGTFGADDILHFNGGLFADANVIDVTLDEIKTLAFVNTLDWSNVEPSVFGTLFERILDPDKRSQIGAHYTGRADIETLLQPVVMQPLRREWETVKTACDELWIKVQAASRKAASRGGQRRSLTPKQSPAGKKLEKTLRDFIHRLEDVTILDPACGSGNFLYVALNLLLDLDKEVISYAAQRGIALLPSVRPTQLLGIEINEYAQELASVVIWIGYLQWMHDNGFTPQLAPVLEPFESIRRMDAILDLSDPANPREPEWPAAEFIVGNPPFLGGKSMLRELGDEYTNALRKRWGDRIGPFADLCCYWFEMARQQIEVKQAQRVGLLATQGIRFQASRDVLERIRSSSRIFWATSDKDWVLEGATVHVSMIGFDNRQFDDRPKLDGIDVSEIYADLTSGSDVASARTLHSNSGRSFIGVQKSGPFELGWEEAVDILREPTPCGLPNSDVIRPYWTSYDVVRRSENTWIADFSTRSLDNASNYQGPFERLRRVIPPKRTQKHFAGYPLWQLWRPRPEMFSTIAKLDRFIVTPQISKHRIFAWCYPEVCPSNKLIVVASREDHMLGLLQSRVHELWSRRLGSQLRDGESGFTYTPTTCFETFPFPEPTDAQREAIAAAAKELDTLRNNWLNPPEWTRTEILEFPGSVDGPWNRYIDPASVVVSLRETKPLAERVTHSVATVRYPRVVPKNDECAKLLKKRTLTNLYNERPTWLDLAHKKLDAAVFAAYGWDPTLSDDDLLAALLALNLERAAKQ